MTLEKVKVLHLTLNIMGTAYTHPHTHIQSNSWSIYVMLL